MGYKHHNIYNPEHGITGTNSPLRGSKANSKTFMPKTERKRGKSEINDM